MLIRFNFSDPTSKHYGKYTGSGYEMWGNQAGQRLDSMARNTSDTPQVVHHHHHHHYSDMFHPPQYVHRGWDGGAAEGFEFSGSDTGKPLQVQVRPLASQ
ncbi:uncharacterized protein L201_003508 [Kwoniella dendrophila CBS 6074]|uniref:Uncharacterized protein n=1 Tax=Kwoniella dendrophila CBS 6074 TaxID=1295534 RepID=A0AAX4JVL1_9TREE